MSPAAFRLLLLGFFLSGSAGLIYQVAWVKALGLVFGHTVYAITTVLAAFMAGLAAGGAWLGRWGSRHRDPIGLYAKLELGIAALGALSLYGVGIVRDLYLVGYETAPDSAPFLVALRFVGAFLVLLPPTFLMGATLPILAAGVTRSSAEFGQRLGRLYWINTAGAVAGVLAVGFLLLPEIGLRLTVAVAVALNVLAAGSALLGRRGRAEPLAAATSEPDALSAGAAAPAPVFLLVSFAIVGATAMIYEVAWSRLLATTLGSSTYAFTIMLATFLAGLGIGGRLFEMWVARRPRASVAVFATTQTLTGLAAVAFLLVSGQLPSLLWAVVTATDRTFGGLVAAQFVTTALAMLPAAVVFGFNFPLVILLIAQSGRAESSAPAASAVGPACAANTIGAIIGVTAAGFWLLPWLGGFRLVALAAAANLAVAASLYWFKVPRRKLMGMALAVGALLAAVTGWFETWHDRQLAFFGVLTNRDHYAKTLTLEEITRGTDLLFAEDGLNASIAVVRGSEYLGLRTNGKVDASTGDVLSQLMLGHLGGLLHPAPKRVLVIGFGSGMTVSAVARYPDVERIDCVEIEPAVIRAAHLLEPLNRGVLADPRLRIIENDARNYLFTTSETYDLIISEPSNPWIAGVASLFTDEFYRQIRSRLAPGGMLVQWVQAYSIFPEDLTTVLATVAGRFAQVTAWRGDWADVLLLAQSEPAPLSLKRAHHFWSNPALHEDFTTLELTRPEGLLAFFRLDDAGLRRLAAATPPDTDDLTRLEYRAPLALLAEDASTKNIELLTRSRSEMLPASITLTDRREALIGAAETAVALDDEEVRASELLSALAAYPPAADVELLNAGRLLSSGKTAEAGGAFENALRLAPSSTAAMLGLSDVARAQADYPAAALLLDRVLAQQPQSVPALERYASLERTRRNWIEAADWQAKRVAADPAPPVVAQARLATMLFEGGQSQQAALAARQVLASDPYSGVAHRILGQLAWRQNHFEEARTHFESVIRYHAAWDPHVYVSLANVYRNLDRPDQAESVLRKAERIFPGNPALVRPDAKPSAGPSASQR